MSVADHEGKWDVKCERGPGVVYINKKMVARIVIDGAGYANIVPTTKVAIDMGIDQVELDRLFRKKLLE